jgi:RNA polymerase sigma-70 factor (ECF subfamily)
MVREKWLIRRFNRGDNEALRDIYGLYRDDMVSLACALLHDRAAAQDAVHDVFVRLIERRESLEITSSLRQYLMTAVANSARRSYCRRKARGEVSLEAQNASEIGRNCPPDAEAIFGEKQQALVRALAALPWEQREVILLRHFGGLKLRTIAARMDASPNTIQGRYRYGLEKLRSLMNGELL